MTTKLPYIETSQLRAALTLLKMSDDVRLVTNCVHINAEHIEVSNGHVVLRMKHNSEFSDDIVFNLMKQFLAMLNIHILNHMMMVLMPLFIISKRRMKISIPPIKQNSL